MSLTRSSKTLSMTLEELVGRLRQRDQIDGIMVIGSAARDELQPGSDYDLVILLSDMPVPIDIGLTHVDDRPTDLNFITVEEMDELLESDKPVNPYTTKGGAFLRMGDGKIELDRSGRLERGQQTVLAGVPLKLFSSKEKYSRWWMMNFFLRLAKRMVVSNDPTYTQAADLMLVGMLDYLMFDYFNFRDLVWKGEKEAVRYWTSQEPGYLDSFMNCLNELDTGHKLQLYEELAEVAAAPVGGISEEGDTALHIRDDAQPESDISATTQSAQDFWATLVDGSSDG